MRDGADVGTEQQSVAQRDRESMTDSDPHGLLFDPHDDRRQRARRRDPAPPPGDARVAQVDARRPAPRRNGRAHNRRCRPAVPACWWSSSPASRPGPSCQAVRLLTTGRLHRLRAAAPSSSSCTRATALTTIGDDARQRTGSSPAVGAFTDAAADELGVAEHPARLLPAAPAHVRPRRRSRCCSTRPHGCTSDVVVPEGAHHPRRARPARRRAVQDAAAGRQSAGSAWTRRPSTRRCRTSAARPAHRLHGGRRAEVRRGLPVPGDLQLRPHRHRTGLPAADGQQVHRPRRAPPTSPPPPSGCT